MKNEYLDLVEFGTRDSLAIVSKVEHYNTQDGWLLYKVCLCATMSF